jgi:HAD superfamily hydrolase (TIGR01549 family)
MPLHVSRIKAICFDVDGTLSDTDDQMVARVTGVLQPIQVLSRKADLSRFARRLVMSAEFPGNFLISSLDFLGLDEPVARLVERVNHLRRHRRKKNFLIIGGVREMLQSLSVHYPLAVVSARDAASTRAFLDQFDLVPFFQCIATAQTCLHTKPFPDPILWAAGQMGVPPDACLMVGDTTVDMRAARAAGAQKVGVLCGFGERDELEKRGADMILSTTPELVQVLLE